LPGIIVEINVVPFNSAADLELAEVVKSTVHLADMSPFQRIAAIFLSVCSV
jgi:hypothetical protein